nr:sucrose synthase SusA1 [Ipomoea batatas]
MSGHKLGRIPSMRERVEGTLSAHRNELVALLSRFVAQGKGILQPHSLIDELNNVSCNETAGVKLSDGPFSEVLKSAGSHSASPLCCFSYPSEARRLGVCACQCV